MKNPTVELIRTMTIMSAIKALIITVIKLSMQPASIQFITP